jgi:hypothetical protein
MVVAVVVAVIKIPNTHRLLVVHTILPLAPAARKVVQEVLLLPLVLQQMVVALEAEELVALELVMVVKAAIITTLVILVNVDTMVVMENRLLV